MIFRFPMAVAKLTCTWKDSDAKLLALLRRRPSLPPNHRCGVKMTRVHVCRVPNSSWFGTRRKAITLKYPAKTSQDRPSPLRIIPNAGSLPGLKPISLKRDQLQVSAQPQPNECIRNGLVHGRLRLAFILYPCIWLQVNVCHDHCSLPSSHTCGKPLGYS